MLADMRGSGMESNQKSMSALEEFSVKATKHKTPKTAKVKRETTKLVPRITPSKKKSMIDQLKFDARNFTVRSVDCIQNIEHHLIAVEEEA